MIEIWADPTISRNRHRVEVVSDSAIASMEIEGMPSADNPRTSASVANSVIAALRRMSDPLVVGT
jgi:aspartate dehydrogenase